MTRGKIWLIAVCWVSPGYTVVGQQSYPKLTHAITFAALKEKSHDRNVEWTNADGSKEQMTVTEMPIPFDGAMEHQTREFVRAVYGRDSIWLRPKMIVFHAMGDGNLQTSLEVSSFLHDEIPHDWGNLSKAGALPNGAHFIIDSDGTIYCLAPPVSRSGKISYEKFDHAWLVKRHQDGNPVAIGVENVTPKNNYAGLTSAQLENNAKLARWLIWFEGDRVQYLASHHQFNDETAYDRFLEAFHLQNLKRNFRTRGRSDIGDTNLSEILRLVQRRGIQARKFFD